MIAQTSWSTYIEIVILLLITYYLIVLLLFFRKDIIHLSFRKIRSYPVHRDTNDEAALSGVDKQPSGLVIEDESLKDEIRALIRQAVYSRSPKEEILYSLHKLLSTQRYQHVEPTPLKHDIRELIIQEFQINGGVNLKDDSLEWLWVPNQSRS